MEKKNNTAPPSRSSKKRFSRFRPLAKSFHNMKKSGPSKEKLKIIVLGGVEEVGRNMSLLEYGNDIILIDMGLQFPTEEMPGVDYVIPNISYLKGKEKNIRAVIITHGHYDHIGAIPHLMPVLNNPPLYAGKMAAGIIDKRQKEFGEKLNIIRFDETTKLKLGQAFNVEFFRVNHTIPDSFGVVIHTPEGTVIHTGDFKIDHTPIYEAPVNLARIAQYGNNGVLAYMGDSTNANQAGHQISERQVFEEMERIVEQSTGRIIIGTFASLLSRIQIVLTLAERFNKKVLIEGRTMKTNVDIAHELGYLKFNPKICIEADEVNKFPDNQLVIIGTGAQAQQNAFLMRYANNEHKYVTVKQGDSVIFSSSVIPGNERTIQELQDTLYRKGAKVYHYQMMDVHAGGHCKQEDLKLMLRLVNPKFFIPIEGHHFMLRKHAEVAESIGIPKENIFVVDNGQVVEFQDGKGTLTKTYVPTDYVFVDGLDVGDSSLVVLRDRKMLAEDGMVVIIATLDRKSGNLVGSPDIISRGFVYLKEKKTLIEETRTRIKKILKDPDPQSPPDEHYLKNKLRTEIGQYLYKKTKKRPMILPVLINV